MLFVGSDEMSIFNFLHETNPSLFQDVLREEIEILLCLLRMP